MMALFNRGRKPERSSKMEGFIGFCRMIYDGQPSWLDIDEQIRTINFAKSVCSELAKLTTLDIGINIDGSARAEWLQEQVDLLYYSLRNWVEFGCACGTFILKPNGDGVDFYTPDKFVITDLSGNRVLGAIFEDNVYADDRYYTRLEEHGFLPDGRYSVTNRCLVADSRNGRKREIDIDATPWVGLQDAVIDGVERPLFGFFRTPAANNIDHASGLGLPVFSEAIEELHDLDVAYSRNAKEILDSKRTVLLDSDRLLPMGRRKATGGYNNYIRMMGLPDYVRAVEGSGSTEHEIYHEINPSLNTEMRLKGINALLSQVGFKCGFSNGYFVFNEKTGMVTATQVESDDRRTIQTVKDMRDKLQDCLDGTIYALDKFADLYDLAPVGEYEVNYHFRDMTYNEDEDRTRWWSYVVGGKVPFWVFLNKFEGYSEEEAKAIEQAAQVDTLFVAEE